MTIRDIVFVNHMQDPALVAWHSRAHEHADDEYELHYFISGGGSFRVGPTSRPIGRHQAFLCLPGQNHAISAGEGDEALTYYAVLFQAAGDELARIGLDRATLERAYPATLPPPLRLVFEKLKGHYLSDRRWLRLESEYTLWALLCEIMAEGEVRPAAPAVTGQAARYVEQAVELFQRHLHDDLPLDQLAARLGISREYLIKAFRREMGVTPIRYYQNLKKEAAIHYLINTALSVKEIGAKLGYSSQFQFSRSFKALTGQSPSGFRLAYLRENPTSYAGRLV